jgi:hypothetical protein
MSVQARIRFKKSASAASIRRHTLEASGIDANRHLRLILGSAAREPKVAELDVDRIAEGAIGIGFELDQHLAIPSPNITHTVTTTNTERTRRKAGCMHYTLRTTS